MGTRAAACLVSQEPSALTSLETSSPRPIAGASFSFHFLYGFLKLPVKIAKAKGSTRLSQAKPTCPSIALYG